jgi:SAM-dependent methyltransferase
MQRLVSVLVDQLSETGPCLEIGVGTGRIALPLARSGIAMTGVDISRSMLDRLMEISRASSVHVDILIADATRLPFRDSTFGSAVAAHVLHLIPRWRDAVGELWRVVRPGGRLVVERGGSTRGDWYREVRRRFFVEAGDPPWPPGLDAVADLDALLQARGAALHVLPELSDDRTASISELLRSLEAGIWSGCWYLDESTRARATQAARSWAEQRFGDLDSPRPVSDVLTWRAYDLPSR